MLFVCSAKVQCSPYWGLSGSRFVLVYIQHKTTTSGSEILHINININIRHFNFKKSVFEIYIYTQFIYSFILVLSQIYALKFPADLKTIAIVTTGLYGPSCCGLKQEVVWSEESLTRQKNSPTHAGY